MHSTTIFKVKKAIYLRVGEGHVRGLEGIDKAKKSKVLNFRTSSQPL